MASPNTRAHRTVRFWITKDIDRTAANVMREMVFRTHANLVAKPQDGGTPRDTGRAAMGWTPSVAAPSAFIPGEGGGTPDPRKALRSIPKDGDPRMDLYETNLVPYIGRLNGTPPPPHSKQAKAGFIEDATERGIRESGGIIAA